MPTCFCAKVGNFRMIAEEYCISCSSVFCMFYFVSSILVAISKDGNFDWKLTINLLIYSNYFLISKSYAICVSLIILKHIIS
jgi:hypothetical protein